MTAYLRALPPLPQAFASETADEAIREIETALGLNRTPWKPNRAALRRLGFSSPGVARQVLVLLQVLRHEHCNPRNHRLHIEQYRISAEFLADGIIRSKKEKT